MFAIEDTYSGTILFETSDSQEAVQNLETLKEINSSRYNLYWITPEKVDFDNDFKLQFKNFLKQVKTQQSA